MRARQDGPELHRARADGWRSLVVGALALLVVVFLFEGARHTVHHLDDDEAGRCLVAAASVHLAVVDVAPIVLVGLAAVGVVVTPRPAAAPALRPRDAKQVRAPPVAPLV